MNFLTVVPNCYNFRVYSGKLTNKSTIYNINKQQTEKIGKLMVAFADEFRYYFYFMTIL